mgnify:CR=1 FL=1
MERKYIKQIARRIEISSHGTASELIAGAFKSKLKGTGLIPAGLRQYSDGDDARAIDWCATSRSHEVMVRTHEEDKRKDVVVMADVGEGITLGGYSESQRIGYAEILSLVAHSAYRANSRVGFCLFSDRVETEKKAKTDSAPLHSVMDSILSSRFAPRPSSPLCCLDYCLSSVRKQSLVFILSDFLSDEDYQQELRRAAFRHSVIGVMIRLEPPFLPPSGFITVWDHESRKEVSIPCSELSEAFRRAAREQSEAKKRFAEARADLLEIDINKNIPLQLVKFFRSVKRLG